MSEAVQEMVGAHREYSCESRGDVVLKDYGPRKAYFLSQPPEEQRSRHRATEVMSRGSAALLVMSLL